MTLNMPGRHNVLNALAAIAVALELGVDISSIQRSLVEFGGIGRRFQATECRLSDGSNIMLVDDYAHHPSEVAATLDAVSEGWPGRRVVLAFQLTAIAGLKNSLKIFPRCCHDRMFCCWVRFLPQVKNRLQGLTVAP